ncbi:MAG: hypothetical protein FWD48_01130 [Oscillospiraceae bacterium]|nr:hypothetical protein [Oscillospiraceae bacterium]
MSKLIDLTGQRFGRLTVVSRAENAKCRVARWKCLCVCGNTTFTRNDYLIKGKTKSCGCLGSELASKRMKQNPINKSHNKSKSRIYNIWSTIKQRTTDPNHKEYHNYGERGIIMHKEWFNSFQSFYDWSIQNGYKENLCNDRKQNNGNYSPDNCRWITNKENCNNKRNNRYITIREETKTLSQWAEIYKINYFTVYSRIKRGWNEIEALTTPVRK